MSKGSRRRRAEVERKVFEDNWDRIYGKVKEERSRELNRIEYTESDNPLEGGAAYFKEGSMQYAEYSIQYNTPTENN